MISQETQAHVDSCLARTGVLTDTLNLLLSKTDPFGPDRDAEKVTAMVPAIRRIMKDASEARDALTEQLNALKETYTCNTFIIDNHIENIEKWILHVDRKFKEYEAGEPERIKRAKIKAFKEMMFPIFLGMSAVGIMALYGYWRIVIIG